DGAVVTQVGECHYLLGLGNIGVDHGVFSSLIPSFWRRSFRCSISSPTRFTLLSLNCFALCLTTEVAPTPPYAARSVVSTPVRRSSSASTRASCARHLSPCFSRRSWRCCFRFSAACFFFSRWRCATLWWRVHR